MAQYLLEKIIKTWLILGLLLQHKIYSYTRRDLICVQIHQQQKKTKNQKIPQHIEAQNIVSRTAQSPKQHLWPKSLSAQLKKSLHKIQVSYLYQEEGSYKDKIQMSKQQSLILQIRHILIYRLGNYNNREWISMHRFYHRLRMEHNQCLDVNLRWSMPQRIKLVMFHSFRWIACRKSLLNLKLIIHQRHFIRQGLLYIWKISHPMNSLS